MTDDAVLSKRAAIWAATRGAWDLLDWRRAFVLGAAWWEYTRAGGTMWPADRDRAAAEAERQFASDLELALFLHRTKTYLTHQEAPVKCARCGTETAATIMSKFDTDVLCMPCKNDEREAPGYRAADAAEVAAVRQALAASGGTDAGNFAGVGLGESDRAFLKARLAARGLTWQRESPEPWPGSGTTAPE